MVLFKPLFPFLKVVSEPDFSPEAALVITLLPVSVPSAPVLTPGVIGADSTDVESLEEECDPELLHAAKTSMDAAIIIVRFIKYFLINN